MHTHIPTHPHIRTPTHSPPLCHQVVVSGCSAGGLAALLHCDHIRAAFFPALPPSAYACLPDAAIFLDRKDLGGKSTARELFQAVFHFHVMPCHPPFCFPPTLLLIFTPLLPSHPSASSQPSSPPHNLLPPHTSKCPSSRHSF
ncbi:unnamed protein product [Closterium sp. NIES-53]